MRKKRLFISMVLLGAVFLSACVGGAIRGTTWPGLAADETTAYLADVTAVYGVDLDDGREVWRFSDKDDSKAQFYSKPVITPDGLVIVGSAAGEHILYALDTNDLIADGDFKSPVKAWTYAGADSPWVAPPLIVEDRLFAPNSNGNLYVFDLNDGRSQKEPLKVIELSGRLWAQPVTDGERVFVTSLDHSIFGIDLQTFSFWEQEISAAIPGSPVIGMDGMLYVGSLASQLERFDPQTGGHESVLDAGAWIWGTPALDEDTLYFGDLDGNFYSFDISTDQQNWSIQPDGAITASAVLQNDHLLLATESGNLYAIDKDGRTLWFEEVRDEGADGKIYTTPVVVGDLILVAPLETEFYLTALDADGRTVWTFVPEN
ncbi:MAG TPA: PQQ-binding-like beta-propeller repeat protein [Anaerolineales bacterium]|nr:PQQ-binding-like beta-propeller repeat protein [Anaerolineales bacterium]